jgi:hypothetical protein
VNRNQGVWRTIMPGQPPPAQTPSGRDVFRPVTTARRCLPPRSRIGIRPVTADAARPRKSVFANDRVDCPWSGRVRAGLRRVRAGRRPGERRSRVGPGTGGGHDGPGRWLGAVGKSQAQRLLARPRSELVGTTVGGRRRGAGPTRRRCSGAGRFRRRSWACRSRWSESASNHADGRPARSGRSFSY